MLIPRSSRRRNAWGSLVLAGLFGLSSIFTPTTLSAQPPQYCPPAQPVPQYCPPGTTHPGIPAPPAPGIPGQPTPVNPGTTDPGMTDPGMTDPGMPDPGQNQPNVDPGQNQPQIFQPPAQQPNFDVAGSGNQSLAPGMVGDFFGSGFGSITSINGGIAVNTFDAPTGATSVVGRQKLVEGVSPMPRDRFFLNYSYFNNTPLADQGVNVNRLTVGIEQTFLDGNASFEFRVPMAVTLDSDVFLGSSGAGTQDFSNWEMGNINMTLKALLVANQQMAVSAGLGITVPTANDIFLGDLDGQGVDISIENDSVHLLPFLGFLHTPTGSRFFSQGVLQLDVDVNGSSVEANNGGGVVNVGTMNDLTFLYASYGIGYFMRTGDSNVGHGWLSSITPIAEIHYSRNLNEGDAVNATIGGNGAQIGANVNTVEVINAVIGTTLGLGERANVTAAYTIPLNSDSDRQFHGEFRALLNINTGSGTSFANRIQ